MRRFVVVSLVVSLAACSRSKAPAYAVGGALAAAGTYVLATGATKNCEPMNHDGLDGEPVYGPDELGCDLSKGSAAILGTTVLLLGLTAIAVAISIEVPDDDEPAPIKTEAELAAARAVPTPATDNVVLRELTVEASLAAQVGHCTKVVSIADRVELIDRTYRLAGFVRDPRIAGCL